MFEKIVKNKFLMTFAVFSSVVLAGYSNTAFAPTGYDAGVIDHRNLIQIQTYEQAKKEQMEEEQKGKEKIELDKKLQDEMDKLPNKEVSFILRSVSFTGNTVYTDEELLHLICDKIDTEVTINELIAYCNLITDYYQQAGYVSSIAYMPPQRIQDGNIDVIITEGKYGNVALDGNKWARDKFITKQFLDDNDIITGNIVNIKDIQEALREINTQGYMQGSVALQDNEESFEYTDVELSVKDRFPIDLDLRFDNQGRNETGLMRGVIFAGMYNLTGFGDKILSTTTLAKNSVGQGVFYTVPIATNETKLNLGYSYSGVSPEVWMDGLGDLDYHGKSHNFFAGISRRLIETERYKLYGDITYDMRNTKSWSENPLLAGWGDSAYKTRAIRLNLTNIKDDFYGRWFANIGGSFGLPWFGATEADYNNYYIKDTFFKLNANLARIQSLPWNSMLILQANGQWSNNPLYSAEQIQFGGISTVRGYQEGSYLADSGVTASAELRFPIPFLGMILPEKLKFIDDSIRLAAFYDFGWMNECWSTQDFENRALMSVGGGVVLKLTKYLSGNVYIGVPIGPKPNDNISKYRVHFTVTSNIL